LGFLRELNREYHTEMDKDFITISPLLAVLVIRFLEGFKRPKVEKRTHPPALERFERLFCLLEEEISDQVLKLVRGVRFLFDVEATTT